MLQQVNSGIVSIDLISINYIFLVDESAPAAAPFSLIEYALPRAV